LKIIFKTFKEGEEMTQTLYANMNTRKRRKTPVKKGVGR
jgi:hypothetical protein